MAVILLLASASKYFFDCVFNCSAEKSILCGFIYSISSKDGGSTFRTILQPNASFTSYDIFAPASEYSLSENLAPSPAPVSITNL